MLIGKVTVVIEKGTLEETIIQYYINKIQKRARGKKLKSLTIYVHNDSIDLRYSFHGILLERIRRIMTVPTYAPEKCVV